MLAVRMERFSEVDRTTSPPRMSIPRLYNAAVDFVERHVHEGRGSRVAYLHARGQTTYGELAECTARVADAMRRLGLAPEQRVMLCMHDTPNFVAVFFGAMRAGCVPVPVNTLLTVDDYAFMLEDSRARALFVSEPLWPKLAQAVSRLEAPPNVIVVPSPVPTTDPAPPSHHFDTLVGAAQPTREVATTTCDDVAFWLYSSGSTGRPKGAVHLHSHLVTTAALYGTGVLGMREDDVVFSAAKLFFAYGLGNAMTFPLHLGATAVLLAERPTPASVLETMAKHEPTIFCGVPTLFASILADRELAAAPGSSRLRASISAGEALPAHVGERWKARFGSDILDGIGSTEMLHIFLSNRHGEVRYGTSGKPVPGYDVKIVDDSGEPAPDGEEGSLWVRGPSACTHYWNQRERSLQTFHGPWTRTGDRYVRDADGYYTYGGRADDMLKVGGIWVSPFEVESALAAHAAVLEAAVVGHADADGLIKPKAFVVLKPGVVGGEGLVAELGAFVKTKLAPYKYPRWVEIVTELPKTATGKIQRFKLRG